MLYLAIILVTALALVIFLHNDHDRSYDKKERRITVAPEQPMVKQKVQPKPEPQPKPKPEPKPEQRRTLTWTYLDGLEYYEDLPKDSMETEVTGMRYYCSLADVGPVNGIIRPEPDKAQGLMCTPSDTRKLMDSLDVKGHDTLLKVLGRKFAQKEPHKAHLKIMTSLDRRGVPYKRFMA